VTVAGQIVTFYSYKGGVGRSFALANVAVVLSGWGYRVLCVDWDLDAPGLGYYFHPLLESPLDPAFAGGVVDAFSDFAGGAPLDLDRFVASVRTPDRQSRFDFIPADSRAPDYFTKAQGLDWSRLYAEHDLGQRLEELRADWMGRYDIVLIDSRTGITDIGGICTAQLPDVLVMLFTANNQSLAGTLDVARRATRARDKLPYDRSRLMIAPVPSRFDAKEEFRRAEQWRETFNKDLAGLVAPWLHREVTVAALLSQLTVPYIPYWSFGEEIAIGRGDPAPGDITHILTTLAALLAHGLDRTELLGDSRDSYVGAAARGPASRPEDRFAFDVLLSYERETDFTRECGNLLRQQKLRVFDWPAVHRGSSAQETVARCRHCVAILDQDTITRVPREVDMFLRQSLDDVLQRQVFQVAPGGDPVVSGSGGNGLRRSDVLPARTPHEAALAAAQIGAQIRLISARDALAAVAGDPAAVTASASQAYNTVAESLLQLGDLAQERGDLRETRARYEAAAGVFADGGLRASEADVLLRLGTMLSAQGDFPAAEEHYQRARYTFLKIGDELAAAGVLIRLGDTFRARGRLDAARRAYQEALARYAENPGIRSRPRLADAGARLGDIAADRGDFDEAWSCYQASLDLLTAESAASPDVGSEILSLYVRMGDIALARGDLDAARAQFRAAADLTGGLTAEPDSEQAARYLDDLHDRLGVTAERIGDLDEARAYFEDRLAIGSARAAADPDSTEWQTRLAASHAQISALAADMGDLTVALEHSRARRKIAVFLAAAEPASPERQRELMHSHLSLGDLAAREGNPSSALRDYQAALDIANRMAVTDRASYSSWEQDKATLKKRISGLDRPDGTVRGTPL
jgi:tetratricopeptide (TPR) repeat protein/cellulose biosynthesis protein BcsQ